MLTERGLRRPWLPGPAAGWRRPCGASERARRELLEALARRVRRRRRRAAPPRRTRRASAETEGTPETRTTRTGTTRTRTTVSESISAPSSWSTSPSCRRPRFSPRKDRPPASASLRGSAPGPFVSSERGDEDLRARGCSTRENEGLPDEKRADERRPRRGARRVPRAPRARARCASEHRLAVNGDEPPGTPCLATLRHEEPRSRRGRGHGFPTCSEGAGGLQSFFL